MNKANVALIKTFNMKCHKQEENFYEVPDDAMDAMLFMLQLIFPEMCQGDLTCCEDYYIDAEHADRADWLVSPSNSTSVTTSWNAYDTKFVDALIGG